MGLQGLKWPSLVDRQGFQCWDWGAFNLIVDQGRSMEITKEPRSTVVSQKGRSLWMMEGLYSKIPSSPPWVIYEGLPKVPKSIPIYPRHLKYHCVC